MSKIVFTANQIFPIHFLMVVINVQCPLQPFFRTCDEIKPHVSVTNTFTITTNLTSEKLKFYFSLFYKNTLHY